MVRELGKAGRQRLPEVPLSSLIHKSQVIECISAHSIASPHTKFGIGLTGRAKQAWLRDDAYGCGYVPGPRELLALHEVSDDVFFTYSSAGPDAVGGASGDSALTITSLPEPEGETTRITIVMLLSPEWARYPA